MKASRRYLRCSLPPSSASMTCVTVACVTVGSLFPTLLACFYMSGLCLHTHLDLPPIGRDYTASQQSTCINTDELLPNVHSMLLNRAPNHQPSAPCKYPRMAPPTHPSQHVTSPRKSRLHPEEYLSLPGSRIEAYFMTALSSCNVDHGSA